MKDLLKDALSDEKGHQSSARWGALGFFALIVFVLFVWLFASLCGKNPLAAEAIKILSTLATTCAAILGAGQVKSAVIGAVSPRHEAAPTPPNDKAKVSLNTARAAMLMAKVQAASQQTTEPSGKLTPPSMGGGEG